MTTKVEQKTNDLLHFSGKVGKLRCEKQIINDDVGGQKRAFRTTSRDARWNVKCSDFAEKTHNPIRAIVDGLKIEPNKEKPMIALSIGTKNFLGFTASHKLEL